MVVVELLIRAVGGGVVDKGAPVLEVSPTSSETSASPAARPRLLPVQWASSATCLSGSACSTAR